MKSRLQAFVRLVLGTVVATTLMLAPPAHAESIAPGDVQSFPHRAQQAGAPNTFLGVSSDYVLHDVHNLTTRPGAHLSVVRLSDGKTVWSDFDASPDAEDETLAGRYYVEKIGDPRYWPTSVRFFDVETHSLAGEIAMPGESLVAIGPGWILTTRDTGATGQTDILIHRLDGSSLTVPGVAGSWDPAYYGTDGGAAWVQDFAGRLVQVDTTTGATTVVPLPAGRVVWRDVVVGPTTIFDVDDYSGGADGGEHVDVTTIDRATGAVGSTSLDGSAVHTLLVPVPLGDGLGFYSPAAGMLQHVDLGTGALSLVASDLSDAAVMGDGRVVMLREDAAPGTIEIADGSEVTPVADLPARDQAAERLSYDGVLRVRWEDGSTTSIDPSSADPAWSAATPASADFTTVSGDTTLVQEADPQGLPSTRWHLSWPGGSRDITAKGLVLGNGGELVVEEMPDGSFQVERVRTGEVVATADDRGAVADGSWVWSWASQSVLHGVDVDDPTAAPRDVTVPTLAGQWWPGLDAVRGRWIMVNDRTYAVIDSRGIVPPYILPGTWDTLNGAPSAPVLGNGFVAWSSWIYANGRTDGQVSHVADLSADHNVRDLVDPATGQPMKTYVADDTGSASLAFLGAMSQPEVLRLPWLEHAPTVAPPADPVKQPSPGDHTPPTLGSLTGPARFTADDRHGVTFSFGASDPSGVASYDAQFRSAEEGTSLGVWTNVRSEATRPTVWLGAPAGSERCLRFRARDVAGNVSAWSAPRCVSVAVQDTAMIRSAHTSRHTTALGADHSYVRLDAAGASLSTRKLVVGRSLAVWLIVGPGQGKVAVDVGGARVATLSAAARSVQRRLVIVPLAKQGRLKLVRVGAHPVGIDAFAVER